MAVRAGPDVPGVTLGGVLGRGASAVVYLGTQERFGRNVAVKVLDMPQGTELAGRMFRSECRTLGRLASHPNILTLFDAGFTEGGQPFLVSEYLPAGTLADRLHRDGPMEWPAAVDVAVQLAGALESTHLHDIAHGDLKPQNVLIGRMGQPVLADFGIARLMSVSNSTALSVLTPLHAAPELFEGADPDPVSDVYGLGSILFQMLDGESTVGLPTDSPLVVVRRVAAGERRALDPAVAPPELLELIRRCLAPDPASRPVSAAELGRALQSIQRGNGLPVTDLPVMGELPDEVIDLTEVAAATGAEMTLPPEDMAAPRSSRVARISVTAAVVVGVLAATLAWAGSFGDGESRAEPATRLANASTTASTNASTTAPTTAVTGGSGAPEGVSFGKAGVQSGIETDLPGNSSTSDTLARKLEEESLIFFPVSSPATTVTDFPLFRPAFPQLPARFTYKSYNGAGNACTPFLTDPITLQGLWERNARWADGNMQVEVAQFVDPTQAHQMFVALSLDQGLTQGECTGIADGRVSDPGALDARHQALPIPISPILAARYNSWLGRDQLSGAAAVKNLIGVVVEFREYVVVIALASNGLRLPEDQVLAQVINEITVRL